MLLKNMLKFKHIQVNAKRKLMCGGAQFQRRRKKSKRRKPTDKMKWSEMECRETLCDGYVNKINKNYVWYWTHLRFGWRTLYTVHVYYVLSFFFFQFHSFIHWLADRMWVGIFCATRRRIIIWTISHEIWIQIWHASHWALLLKCVLHDLLLMMVGERVRCACAPLISYIQWDVRVFDFPFSISSSFFSSSLLLIIRKVH